MTAEDSQLEIGVGDQRLRLPLEVVEAVALAPAVTLVPGTPARLAGLINHQGTVYPAVHPTGSSGEGHHVVLVRTARHGRLALLCDWVHDLVAAAPDVELLDVDALAAEVVAAYATVDQLLPRPARPRAIARLRGRIGR